MIPIYRRRTGAQRSSADLPDAPTSTLLGPFKGFLALFDLWTLSSHYHLNDSKNNIVIQTGVWRRNSTYSREHRDLLCLQDVVPNRILFTWLRTVCQDPSRTLTSVSVVLIAQLANPHKGREGGKGQWGRTFRKSPSKNQTNNNHHQVGFLRLAIGSEHNLNHILPSVGGNSSAAQSVGLAGTIFQLDDSDSNDNSCCWERIKCKFELKILVPSMLKIWSLWAVGQHPALIMKTHEKRQHQ